MAGNRDQIAARPPKTAIADWIKTQRERRRWTQAEFAERLGTSFQQVSKWEKGRQRPAWQWTVQLADMFGADPMRLLALAEWIPERYAPGGVKADMAALAASVNWNDDRVAWFEAMVSDWRRIDEQSGVRADGRAHRSPA